MKKLITTTLVTVALTLSGNVLAGDAAAGKAKSALCAGCHGAAGISNADIYPNLAGQKKGYLISALKGYRGKTRNGGMSMMMQPMAANLSDADIDNLAAYYSGLK
jgi:cytochrome c553